VSENPKIIFISHAAVDHEIAFELKNNISATFSNVEIFVSSDPESLAPRGPVGSEDS
jgi:hypothetical protein